MSLMIWIRQYSGSGAFADFSDTFTPKDFPVLTPQIPVLNNATISTLIEVGAVNTTSYPIVPGVTGTNTAIGINISATDSGIARVELTRGADNSVFFFFVPTGPSSIQIFSDGTIDDVLLSFSSPVGGALWDFTSSMSPSAWLMPFSGTELVSVGSTNFAPSAMRGIVFPIALGATQVSANDIPANSFVLRTTLIIGTLYSLGTTITIGNSAFPALLQIATDNNPEIVGQYGATNNFTWGGSNLPVQVTVAGAPAAGAGQVVVEYIPTPLT